MINPQEMAILKDYCSRVGILWNSDYIITWFEVYLYASNDYSMLPLFHLIVFFLIPQFDAVMNQM